MISRALIAALPKSDVHTHLDGAMRISTLIDLAREQGVQLPSYEVSGLQEQVFKPIYRDLSDYLLGFEYMCAVLRQPEALARAAYEMAEDVIAQGVRYLEVRFAPQRIADSGEACVQAFKAVHDGLTRAARTFNQSEQVRSQGDLPFEWSIICCAMRHFGRGMGPYFDRLLDMLPGMTDKELSSVASLEAIRSAVVARDKHGVPVMGFDLAGEEAGYRAGHHDAAYVEAHRHFIRKTVHAGEAYGPESIYDAIVHCHAERIGHGTFLFDAARIKNPTITDRQAYTESLAEYIATMRITLEVCPTSNLQTIPELEGKMCNHPVKRMLDYGMSVAVATDNLLVSNTNINQELALVADACELDLIAFKRLVLGGFKAAFYPGRYIEKKRFVQRAAERIDWIIAQGVDRKQVGGV